MISRWSVDIAIDFTPADVLGVLDVEDRALAGLDIQCAFWLTKGRVTLIEDPLGLIVLD